MKKRKQRQKRKKRKLNTGAPAASDESEDEDAEGSDDDEKAPERMPDVLAKPAVQQKSATPTTEDNTMAVDEPQDAANEAGRITDER